MYNGNKCKEEMGFLY